MAASWLARRGRSEWGNISGGLAPGNGYDELVARHDTGVGQTVELAQACGTDAVALGDTAQGITGVDGVADPVQPLLRGQAAGAGDARLVAYGDRQQNGLGALSEARAF